MSSFKNLKIFEEVETTSYFSIIPNRIFFFDQLDPSKKWGIQNNQFLFISESPNFEEKKYSLKIKFKVKGCSEWELKQRQYNV